MPNVLIEPEKLERLRSIVWKSRARVVGTLTGVHQSPHFGASVEFREHKEYSPGDDLRYLDWKIFGRSDKYYVKRFEKETNVRAYLMLDASGSMDYGTTAATKFQQGATLASSLAFLLLSQADAVGLCLFGGDRVQFIPPKSRSSHLKILHACLNDARPAGNTAYESALQTLLPQVRRRSLFVLISDFLDLGDRGLDRAIGMIRRVRGDVAVFHVIDPSEEEFPFRDRTEFVGLEAPVRVLCYPQTVRRRYQEIFRAFAEGVRSVCLSNGVEYSRVTTADPVDRFLFGYLERRAQHLKAVPES